MPRRSQGTASWDQTGGSAVWEPARPGLDHCQLPAPPQDGSLNHPAFPPWSGATCGIHLQQACEESRQGENMETSLVTHRDGAITQVYSRQLPSLAVRCGFLANQRLSKERVFRLSGICAVIPILWSCFISDFRDVLSEIKSCRLGSAYQTLCFDSLGNVFRQRADWLYTLRVLTWSRWTLTFLHDEFPPIMGCPCVHAIDCIWQQDRVSVYSNKNEVNSVAFSMWYGADDII